MLRINRIKELLILSFILFISVYYQPLVFAQHEEKAESDPHAGTEVKPEGDTKSERGLIQQLRLGNQRFMKGDKQFQNFIEQREELTKGQHPGTIVVTCSDSRVCPEYLFDAKLGEVFVIRTAGNVIDSAAMGSIEYAAEHLHSRILLILGHSSCGAVTASLGEMTQSPYINSIIRMILPAVEVAKAHSHDEKDVLNEAIKENVKNQMKTAASNSTLLKHLIDEGFLSVMGGVYNIGTGAVDMIDYTIKK